MNGERNILREISRELDFKLKSDIFDEEVPLPEFFSQFDLIVYARINEIKMKIIVLILSLRKKEHSVLVQIRYRKFIVHRVEIKIRIAFRRGISFAKLLFAIY